MSTEQQTRREKFDADLKAAGWLVDDPDLVTQEFDLVVVDESHRFVCITYGEEIIDRFKAIYRLELLGRCARKEKGPHRTMRAFRKMVPRRGLEPPRGCPH